MKFKFLPENFSRSENAPPFETRKIRLFEVQCIRNFELTFRSRQNSVFYFSAETSGKLHCRTEWSEYFSKQAENQFSCSRPRATGLLNICTRLLYPIKPKTVFKIIWGQIVQFAMRTHGVVKFNVICNRVF